MRVREKCPSSLRDENASAIVVMDVIQPLIDCLQQSSIEHSSQNQEINQHHAHQKQGASNMELQERVITELQKEEGRITGLLGRDSAPRITSLILIVLCLFFALHRQNPPDAQPASAPVDQ